MMEMDVYYAGIARIKPRCLFYVKGQTTLAVACIQFAELSTFSIKSSTGPMILFHFDDANTHCPRGQRCQL